MKCPGQDLRYWRPGDIFEAPCAQCGAIIEFWKDDVRRKCPRCGNRMINPKLDFGCAAYCRYAEQCVGNLPEVIRNRRSIPLKERLAMEVREFWGSDLKRLAHAKQVSGYAEELVRQEGGDPNVVIAAGLLHDVGIPEAIRKYGSADGPYQEKEGPPIARQILERAGVDPEVIEEICHIIAHHHSPGSEETLNFRIVNDADWLVNGKEEFSGMGRDELEGKIRQLFLTDSGTRKAREIFLEEEKPSE